MTPIIAVEPTRAGWRLMATSYGHTAIAGPRIFRAPPFPDIKWEHETKDSAERDAAALQAYLAAVAPKWKKKTQARSAYEE